MGRISRVLCVSGAIVAVLVRAVVGGVRATVASLFAAIVVSVSVGDVALLGISAAPGSVALVVFSMLPVIGLLSLTRAVRAVLMACGACAVAAFRIPCMAVFGVLALCLGPAGGIAVLLRVGVAVALRTRLRPFVAAVRLTVVARGGAPTLHRGGVAVGVIAAVTLVCHEGGSHPRTGCR